MLSVEELFSLAYLLVSTVCLVCQLRGQSFVTVECRDVWVFCLENKQLGASTRYVLDGDTVASRCNGKGTSGPFRLFVFFLTSLQLLIFCVVVYGRRPKTKRRNVTVIGRKLSFKLISTLFVITAILIAVLLVLPLVQYHVLATTTTAATPGSSQGGFLDKIFHSPSRVLLSFVISLVTAPLRSILQEQFTLELDWATSHANFTCVEPTLERARDGHGYKCPAEFSWPAGGAQQPQREPSGCKERFYCIDDCEVTFPAVVISSLCVILASFALCYRLLRLRHGTSQSEPTLKGRYVQASSEEARGETSRVTTVADRQRDDAATSTMPSDASSFSAMKGDAAKSTKASTSDRAERQSKFVQRGTRGTKITNFEGHGISDRENGANVEDLRGNGHHRVNGNRQCLTREVNGSWRASKKTETRGSENRVVLKTRTAGRRSFRGETKERLEEVDRCCSSSSEAELGEVTFVEDESEHYMSGFRL